MSFESVRASRRKQVLAKTKLLTFAEIERRWEVSARTIGRLVESGKLTPTFVGERVRIAEAEWLRYLDEGARRSA